MKHITDLSKKVLQQSFLRYVFVGGVTFGLDFLLLVLLHGGLHINLLVAATLSYWSAILFNFFANRLWTFQAKNSGVGKNAALYVTLLAINYLFSIGFIALGTHLGLHYAVAKIIAVVVQIAWTYIAYKKIVFRNDNSED